MSTGGETRASQRVRGRGGRAFAVDRLLHGGDEISEERLGRRGLDAVFGIDMRVLEILGEETILYRLDKLRARFLREACGIGRGKECVVVSPSGETKKSMPTWCAITAPVESA